MVKPNSLIVAVLFCCMIVSLLISHVEGGAQQCEYNRVGSRILGAVAVEKDESLENSLVSNAKLTRKLVHGKSGHKHVTSSKKERRLVVSSHTSSKRKSVKIHSVLLPNKKHRNTSKSSAKTLVSRGSPVGISTRRVTAQEIIANSLPSFDGSLGPTDRHIQNRKPVTRTNRLMPQVEAPDQSLGSARCVACRVDCEKAYSGSGSIFTSCGQKYYYYGCQHVKPCVLPSSGSDDEIQGMVGICVYRNGCQFKPQWNGASSNPVIANRLTAFIRRSGQTPE